VTAWALGAAPQRALPLRPALAGAVLASLVLHVCAVLGFHGPSGAMLAVYSAPAMSVRVIAGSAAVVVRQSVIEESARAATSATAPEQSSISLASRAARPPAAPAAAGAPVPPIPTDASGLPAAPAYRGVAGLDASPAPLHDILPEYPPSAGQQEGSVVLRLLINEKGHVDNVAVVRAFPKGFFEAASIAAFAPAEFSPGSFLGVPVKSQIMVEVHFTPIDRGGTVSGHGY
jgi:TonB family protein